MVSHCVASCFFLPQSDYIIHIMPTRCTVNLSLSTMVITRL